jgi:hypothetical protein
MNAFCEHHRDSIRFGYHCFDRILLNGLIQPFQQPERVVGFFDTTGRSIRSAATCCAGRPNNSRGGSRMRPSDGTLPLWRRQRAAATNSPIFGAPSRTRSSSSSRRGSRRGEPRLRQ